MLLHIIYVIIHVYAHNDFHTDTMTDVFFTTWVKKDNGLEGRVLVVVDLNVLERLHQLVQHSVGYLADLRLGGVPVDHAAVACGHQARCSVRDKQQDVIPDHFCTSNLEGECGWGEKISWICLVLSGLLKAPVKAEH